MSGLEKVLHLSFRGINEAEHWRTGTSRDSRMELPPTEAEDEASDGSGKAAYKYNYIKRINK